MYYAQAFLKSGVKRLGRGVWTGMHSSCLEENLLRQAMNGINGELDRRCCLDRTRVHEREVGRNDLEIVGYS